MGERTCPVRGRWFVPRTGSHTWCSPVCRERSRSATRAPGKAARYGWAHQRLRKQVGRAVETGTVPCVRCGELIDPWDDWDLDHSDDGEGYAGAAHAYCNRAAGAAKSQRSKLVDPEPENTVERWSRHWGGPANPRCPGCRELGRACEEAAPDLR